MKFPEAKRFKYSQNPLQEVVCQFRFPAIPSFNETKPIEFQKTILDKFPILGESQTFTIEITESNGAYSTTQTPKLYYELITVNRDTKVTLTADSIAFSTSAYTQWEDFIGPFGKVINSFQKTYKVQSFNMIGLRYINFVDKAKLGLEKTDWVDLINPSLIGILGCNAPSDIKGLNGQFISEIENGSITARYGLGAKDESPGFIIDSDFQTYSEKALDGDLDAGLKKLRGFKEEAHRFFQWAILPRLHEAMEPREIT